MASTRREEGLKLGPGLLFFFALVVSILIGASGCGNVGAKAPSGNSSGSSSGGALSTNSQSVNFGNVAVGSSASQSFTLMNTGSTTVTVSQVTITSSTFTLLSPSLPVSVGAGQNVTAQIQFAPQAAGSTNASASVVNSTSNSPVTIQLAGTGVQAEISAIPSSVSFGSVATGTSNSQTIKLSNPGAANLTVTHASVSGTGFSISGLSPPITIAAGANTTFNAVFAPNAPGVVSGSISLTSDAPGSPMSIPLSATGTSAALVLTASPSSLNFGNVAVGNTSSHSVTLTNLGNSSVTISQATASGAGYSVSGVAANTTLLSGQSATLTVSLTPTSTGSATGSATVTSNATNSPTTVTLTGESHVVSLSWTASTSTVSGYNIYRGTTNNGPYPSKLDTSLVSGTGFTDSSVQSGQTYYYVVTAVDSNGVESVYSNQASASIP